MLRKKTKEIFLNGRTILANFPRKPTVQTKTVIDVILRGTVDIVDSGFTQVISIMNSEISTH